MTFVDAQAERRAARVPEGGARPGAIAHGETDCEVCVVGASLAGLWLALGLALRGRDVLLLDSRDVPASDQSLRRETLRPGLGLTATALCAIADRDTARRLHHLSELAHLRAIRLLEALGLEPEAEGFIHVPGPRGRLDLIDEAAARDTLGLPSLAQLGAGHTAALLGTGAFVGGLHDPQAATYRLPDLPRRLAAAAAAAGVRIIPRSPLVGADVNGVRKYLICPTLRVRADHVVFCSEAGLAAPAPWLRRALARAFRVDGTFAPRSVRGAADETAREGGDLGLTFAWQAGKLHVSAPTATKARGAGAASVILRRHGSRLFPQLRGAVTGEAGATSYGVARHGLPLIGSARAGVWYAVALGRQPVVNAAMAVDLITAAIADRDDTIAAFRPFAAERSRQILPSLARPLTYWMGRLSQAAERRRGIPD